MKDLETLHVKKSTDTRLLVNIWGSVCGSATDRNIQGNEKDEEHKAEAMSMRREGDPVRRVER